MFFTPTPEGDGVLLTNGSDVVTFQGASTYTWLEKLSPHLNGGHSVGDLTSGLPPAKRQMVERLVGALHEAGLVRDVGADEPHTLSEEAVSAYASQIAFIEAFRTSPARRFQRYRESRVCVVGAGTVFTALVEAVLLSGAARVTARPVTDEPGDRARLEALAASAGDRDPGQRLTTEPLDGTDRTGLARAAAAADVLLAVTDSARPALLAALDEACGAAGTMLITATVVGDEAWIGPVCAPERVAGAARWESLWRRVGTGDAPAPEGRFLTGPVPGIIANHLAFRAFEYVTGVADDAADTTVSGRVVHLDLETLQTVTHALSPHPAAVASASNSTTPVSDKAVDAEELAERVVAVTDARLGVLAPVTEEHLDQFPLRVVRLAVEDPGRPGEPFDVWGAGTDFDAARDAALRHGLASYAARATAPGDARGVALADGTARPVPVPGESAAVGVAAGVTWADAVEQGLLDHVQHGLPVGAVPDSARPLDLADLQLTETAQRFHGLLAATGGELRAYAVDALDGAFVRTVALDAELVAHGAGFTADEAVESALGQLLLSHQAAAADQPQYAPSPAVRLRTGAREPGEGRYGPLVEALRARGKEPVAVPLDGAAAVTGVLPHLLKVVLLDG
ncbi:hypothetical protein CP970_30925 [Streptomyces kanamyceticus]|uniref:Thiazole-containing bacteriocin maturation protein n=1 Tax=Streptomyces kanamyceticus TaxID=1967 RepID=A0A5J6GL70_STRKN|nr:hypothetical protein CP970_30925 [Streptomyces kanamyceticus]